MTDDAERWERIADDWAAQAAQAGPAGTPRYVGTPESAAGDSGPDAARLDELFPIVDWRAAFTDQPEEIDWLVEPMFERGRSYAVYGPAKVGKSLIMQDLAARLSAGLSALGNAPGKAITVLYVDLENAVTDVVERMIDYGLGPDDLAGLCYLSFPALPPLDTAKGGAALVALAQRHQADLVIVDTVSRVISGGENDSDTLHNVYRLAVAPLKAQGITVVRLDHSGKDITRGQRGTSAKATDVDVVWRLDPTPDGVTLVREESRNTHHPQVILLERFTDPLRHVRRDGPPPPGAPVAPPWDDRPRALGTVDTVRELDRLGVPDGAGRNVCRDALIKVKISVSTDTLGAAVRVRKARVRPDRDLT